MRASVVLMMLLKMFWPNSQVKWGKKSRKDLLDMIETLKTLDGKSKIQLRCQTISGRENWFQENVIKRKLVIFPFYLRPGSVFWLEHSILQNAKPTQMSSLKPSKHLSMELEKLS